jgi:hypothetical protein
MADDILEESFEMEKPVLRDGNGKELYTFKSAVVSQWTSGKTKLNTIPKIPDDNFPFALYVGTPQRQLRLSDPNYELAVVFVGDVLAPAPENPELSFR